MRLIWTIYVKTGLTEGSLLTTAGGGGGGGEGPGGGGSSSSSTSSCGSGVNSGLGSS